MHNEQLAASNRVFSQRFQKRHIDLAKTSLLLLSAFIILTVAYYHMFRTVPRQSDLANTLLAGYDMSKGNWRLKDWWLGADNFATTDIVFYAILVKCLGFTPQIMFYLPAMLWAGVALLAVVLAQGGLAQRNKKVAVAAVATPILLPIIRDHAGMSQISESPMHIGTIIYVLLCFLLVKKVMTGQTAHSRSMLFAYSLIMLLAVFADPLAIFIGAIPVMIVAGYSAFYCRNPGPHRVILALTVLAVVLGRTLIGLNSRTGGFEPCTQIGISFVAFDDLGKNIAVTLHYFFILFGCDFFGKNILTSPIGGAALSLIRLPFFILLIVALFHVGRKFYATLKGARSRRWPIVESDYLDALLAVGFAINVLSAVFSTQMVESIMTIRYFFPALVFGAILIARLEIGARWLGGFYYLALLASLAFTGVAYARGTVATDSGREALSAWLSSNHLNDGFGPYWSSSIVTALTANRVKVRALISDGQGKLKPFEFMANRKWYRDGVPGDARGVFVLVYDVADAAFYSEADVIRSFGEPREKHQIGSYIINVYDPGNDRLRALSSDRRAHAEGAQEM